MRLVSRLVGRHIGLVAKVYVRDDRPLSEVGGQCESQGIRAWSRHVAPKSRDHSYAARDGFVTGVISRVDFFSRKHYEILTGQTVICDLNVHFVKKMWSDNSHRFLLFVWNTFSEPKGRKWVLCFARRFVLMMNMILLWGAAGKSIYDITYFENILCSAIVL